MIFSRRNLSLLEFIERNDIEGGTRCPEKRFCIVSEASKEIKEEIEVCVGLPM